MLVTSPQYFRISDTLNYNAPATIEAMQPFVDLGIPAASSWATATFIMFETLNYIDTLMGKITFPKDAKWIWGLRGSDMIASKSAFALTMQSNNKMNLIPPTWITESASDYKLFTASYNPSKIYILKQNIQRQEGFAITNDLATLNNAFKASANASVPNNWVVVQELLQNPLVITGNDGVARKINLRVYMLVIVNAQGRADMYMYNDGFIYYTADPWTANSLERGPNITTGYIDRQVYVDNPLTIKDLYKHMGPKQGTILKDSLQNAMQQLASVYKPIFASNNSSFPGNKFLIYGCDVAPDSELNVTFMEVNKGPDLGYKDERDRNLKLGMMREACAKVGIGQHDGAEHFIRI